MEADLSIRTPPARSACALPEARAQVLVTSAGSKAAAISVGTAVAGVTIVAVDPRWLLPAVGCVVLVTAGVTVLDRRARPVEGGRSPG